MDLIAIQNEINIQIGNKETFNALVETTFKGLAPQNVKKAIMEGMMRGFTFKDFLEKNVYALPYGAKYSLVSSIDYARKIGMRSGVTGKSAPEFVDDKDGKPLTCSVTVERTINGKTGKFTATVYFSEFSTGKNLWATKPRTMIAKVAEMHALRMACPEELAQSYVEEEMKKEIEKPPLNVDGFKEKLNATKTIDELKQVWSALPIEAKQALEPLKAELKKKFETPATNPETKNENA